MDQSENERRGLGTAFVVFVPHAIQTARAGPFCSTFQYADTNPADFARLPDEASGAAWAFVKAAVSGPNWPHPWARDNLSRWCRGRAHVSLFGTTLRPFLPMVTGLQHITHLRRLGACGVMTSMGKINKAGWRFRHLTLWCLILGGNVAVAAPRRISKDLQQSSEPQLNVIIQYRVPPTRAHFARVMAKGGTLRQNFPAINGGVFTGKSQCGGSAEQRS